MLLIINGIALLTTLKDERVLVYILEASLSLSDLMIYYRRKVPVVVHVIVKCPPEQADATPEGDIITVPAYIVISITRQVVLTIILMY